MLTLYVKHHCPWCVEAIHWLRHQKIKFNILDVIEDTEAYQRMRQISSQSLTPTLELENGAVLADFDVSQLEKFLEEHHIQ